VRADAFGPLKNSNPPKQKKPIEKIIKYDMNSTVPLGPISSRNSHAIRIDFIAIAAMHLGSRHASVISA
jgi:hypothetical protein